MKFVQQTSFICNFYLYFSHLYLSSAIWSDWAANSLGVGSICFFFKSRLDALNNYKFKLNMKCRLFEIIYLVSPRLSGLMLEDREFDRKSIVPITRLCRWGDLDLVKLISIFVRITTESINYFVIESLDALDIESKLFRSDRCPTFGRFTTRTDGGDASLFLLLILKFLFPPTKR